MHSTVYDVIIIGGGPAGLTAAIYTSRSRMRTLVVESFSVPGQAVITTEVENYPGFPEVLDGFGLIERFKKQATNFGTEYKVVDVERITEHKEKDARHFRVESKNESFHASCVIIATGARPKTLGVPGEEKLRGKGVSYCAVCDAALFKEKEVAVIGGGDTAIEEALFLSKFASKITVVHRRDALRATKILQERAVANKKIDFAWNAIVKEIAGGERVEAVLVTDVKDGNEKRIACQGVFIFVGYTPNSDFLKGFVKLDKDGYVITDDVLKTSTEGVFACGDIRKKLLRQIVTACGDGATAAFSARLYLENLHAG
jgi:thioredoxin reductase (NADPH)